MISEEEFREEITKWADKIGVGFKEIHLREMKSKWASCSSLGRLTFNSELLDQPYEFRKEVIIHELLHLKLPNHGKLFQTLLKGYLNENFCLEG